jgi:hypothetical protein
MDFLSKEVKTLQNELEYVQSPRVREQILNSIQEKGTKIEQVDNATRWAREEANDKFASSQLDLMNKFGIDQLPHYEIGADTAFVGSPHFIKEAKKLYEEKDEYAQNLLDKYGPQSTGETVNSIPATRIHLDESGNVYGEVWNPNVGTGGKFQPGPLGDVLTNIFLSKELDSKVVEPIGVKDKKLDKFKEADVVYFDRASNPADENGSYLVGNAFKKDKKDNNELIGQYKVYLNTPSQQKALASAYWQNNNRLDAVKWSRPDIKQIVDKNLQAGGLATTGKFNIPIDNNSYVEVSFVDNGWIVRDPTTGRKSDQIFRTKTELTNYLYEFLY